MGYTMKTNLSRKENYGKKRDVSSIKYIVIHYTANDGDSDESNAKYFKNNIVKASAHYFVDDDSVTQSVPDDYVAYSVGGSKWKDCDKTGGGKLYGVANNNNTISIEMCDSVKDGVVMATDKTVENAISLCRTLMAKYNIDINHVIRHFDVNGKHCPVYYMDEVAWNAFKNRLVVDETVKDAKESYIKQVAEFAKKYADKYGFKIVSPTIGQFCKESAFGTSDKVVKDGVYRHNYAGLKYKTDTRVPASCGFFNEKTNEEYVKGTITPITGCFYKFDSLEACVEGYYQFLTSKEAYGRYDNLIGLTDVEKFCKYIAEDGYATGSNYGESLYNDYVIKYDLTRFDSVNEEVTEEKFKSYVVAVEIPNLNIRKGPGTVYDKTGKFTGIGKFTIVEVSNGVGSKTGWGKLKSGAGWISLDFAKKL